MPWVLGDPIRIIIPGTPKPLERNRHRIIKARNGTQFVGNYLPAKSRNTQAIIRDLATQAMGNRSPLEGPIDLRLVAYMPVPASWSKKKQAAALADQIRPTGRPDASNLLKQFEDGLSGIVFRDDAQITDPAGPWKRYSDRPRIVAEVRALTWTD